MNSLFQVALLALMPTGHGSSDLQACAKLVGATTTATRLGELPPPVRAQLVERLQAAGGKLADSGAKLLETDAPTEVEKDYARERFEGGMLVHGQWFAQVKEGQFAGVLTYAFVPQTNGSFVYTPMYSFRGPPCASIQAALAGVTAVPDL